VRGDFLICLALIISVLAGRASEASLQALIN
jgi:hypothetical protein